MRSVVCTLAVKGEQGWRAVRAGARCFPCPSACPVSNPTTLCRPGAATGSRCPLQRRAGPVGRHLLPCGLVAALGGTYSGRVDDATTHLLVFQPDAPSCSGGSSPAASDSSTGGGSGSSSTVPATAGVQPAVLLETVSMQCGGPAAVMALQRRLQAGALLVLPHRWAGVAERTLCSEAEQLGRAFHLRIAMLRRLSALCCCVAVRLTSRDPTGLYACRRLQDLAAVVEDLCTGVPPPALEGGVGLAMAAGCDDWAAWPWERFATELERHQAASGAATAAAATAATGMAASQPVAAATALRVETAQDGGVVTTQAATQQAGALGKGPAARGKASGGQRAAAAGRRGAAMRGSSPEAGMALPAKPSGPLGQLGQATRRAAVADLLVELPSQLPASQPAAAADFAWPASQPAASAARALGSRRGGRAVRSQPFACGADAEAGFGAFAASQPVGLAELAALVPPPPACVQSKPEEPAVPAAPAAAQPVGRPEVGNLAGSSEDEGPSQPAAKRGRSGSPSAAAAPHPGPPTLAACEAPAAISGLGGRGGNAPAPPAPASMFAVLCSRWNLSSAVGTAGTAGAAAAGAACRAGTAALGTAGAAAAVGGSSGSAVVMAGQPAPPAAPPAAPTVAAAAAHRPPLPGGTTLALLLGLPTNDPSASGTGHPAPAAAHPPAATWLPGERQVPAAVEAAAAPADSQGSQGSGAAEDAGEEAAWAGQRNRISRMRAQFQASQEGSQLYYLD